MKKIFSIMALAAVAAIALSCSKEETAANTGKDPQQNSSEAYIGHGEALMSFGATTPDIISNRLTVNLSTGATAFQENDEALVFVDGSNYAIYKYNGEKFEIKEGEQPVALSSAASVFYPANEFFVSNNRAIFEMPFPVETSAGLGDINPMAGMISGDPGNFSVTFRNFVSVLRVKVTADENIEEVAIDFGGLRYGTSNAYDKAWFDVDASNCEMVYAGGGEYTTSIYLDTPAKSADVLFLIPTLELEDGLNVTAVLEANHNGGSKTFTVTNASTAARARNTVSTMSFFAGLFSGGAGTAADPYKISTARDLKYLKKYSTEGYGSNSAEYFLAAAYKQTADIDFNQTSLTPVGTEAAPFGGHYDGQGHSLDNFVVSIDDYAGVFGVIANGTVENLVIGNKASVTTTVNTKGAGAIVGKLVAGTVSGCTNNAPVNCSETSGNSYVGGIVGLVHNTTASVSISECVNNGAVRGNIFVGGIAGSVNAGSYSASVYKCINNAAVTANGSNAGGIAGALYKGTVNLCYGGKATVSSNYPTGGSIIKSPSRSGGLVGIMNNANAWVINSSSRAFVWTTGNNAENYKAAAGGLVGYINTAGGHIVNCVHWNMQVANTGASAAADAKDKIAVGGIVGYIAGSAGVIANCYTQRHGNVLGCYKVSGSAMTALCLANNTANGTWIGQVYGYNKGIAVNCFYPTLYPGVGTNAGTDHITGVTNDVKNGTADATDVSIYNVAGSSVVSTVSGKLWEILEAGKGQTGWTGSDDMSWTHYASGDLEVAIPTVIYNAGSAYYL